MINVSPKHLQTIKLILSEHVGNCEVRAFGSRLTQTSKENSDLDLAIVAPEKMKRRTKMLLREAFEESDLPFRIDIIDYNAASAEFRSIIDKNYEILQQGKQTSSSSQP